MNAQSGLGAEQRARQWRRQRPHAATPSTTCSAKLPAAMSPSNELTVSLPAEQHAWLYHTAPSGSHFAEQRGSVEIACAHPPGAPSCDRITVHR
jgi:hypothetical protein